MRAVDIVITVGWIAFWIYWLAASTTAKAGRGNWTRFAGLRIGVIVIVLLLLRLGVLKGHEAATIWARLYIGRNWGMPMTQKAEPELVTTGPYHRVRHPIYSGIILAMVGTAVAVSVYWLVAVALIGGYFIYSAVMEERYMAGQFPDAYPAYKQSTKMLIPFIF
jgi:protein-S-isoprenylcysteine O-methyltransferase Ste14